jgi:hypothetical protein
MLKSEESILLFMIEGPGKAMDLVKQHFENVLAIRKAQSDMLESLGFNLKDVEVWRRNDDFALTGVRFVRGKPGPEWIKPDAKGRTRPKRGTELHKKFYAVGGITPASQVIAKAFNVPLGLGYKTNTGQGWTAIGRMLNECGFLYMSKDGPYAMWVPNVPQCVAEFKESMKKYKSLKIVNAEVEAFKPEFEGCRPILEEEWDLLVAQHKLDAKRKSAEEVTA